MDARTAAAGQVCSVARTAALLADPWTVLVVRDLGRGVTRFDALAERLGVARTVLSRRLDGLVGDGVVERVDYREPGSRTRAEYRLTRRGRDLGVVLAALMDFGDRHLAGDAGPPVVRVHEHCGAPVRLVSVCAEGHRLGGDDRVRLVPGPGAPTGEQEPR
ncbi:winged helix-turn-helix transcriptional regulator [Pseudonocardia spirodelae]|uniref:Helix-turn-helix domain-containing protein n=1 Tax=Pseudonocardia spirodelae TaxID=3133431 RepID=A0ABU8T8E1_9PSEU